MNRPLSAPEIAQHQQITALPPAIQDAVRVELLTNTYTPERLANSLNALVDALSKFARIVRNLALAKAVAKNGKPAAIKDQIDSAPSFLELGDVLDSSKTRSDALSEIQDHTRTEAVVSRVLETPTISDIKRRYGITGDMENHPEALRVIRTELCTKFNDIHYLILQQCTLEHAQESFPSTSVVSPGNTGAEIFHSYFTRTLDNAQSIDRLYATIIMAEISVRKLREKQAA